MNRSAVVGAAGHAIPRAALRAVLVLLLPVAMAACGEAPRQAATTSAIPSPQLDYLAKRPIPVRLDMHGTADGGRAVAISGAWRGEVAFDGVDAVAHCGIKRGDLPAIEPGSSHEVHMVCARAVRLPDEGSRHFRVLEDGREIATGVVLP